MTGADRPVQWVYFLRAVGLDGPVKIGCSVDPDARRDVYSKISPFPLEVVAKIPGSPSYEWRFHTRFVHLHSHHEWFHAAPELTAAIEQINAGTFDLETLPRAKPLPGRGPRRLTAESKEWVSLAHRYSWLRRRGVSTPTEIERAVWDRYRAPQEERDRLRVMVREYLDEVAPLRPRREAA
jgi:hypothetical protein